MNSRLQGRTDRNSLTFICRRTCRMAEQRRKKSPLTCLAVSLLFCATGCLGQTSGLPCTVIVPTRDYLDGACVFILPGMVQDTDVECGRIEQLFADATGIYGGDLFIHRNHECGIVVCPAVRCGPCTALAPDLSLI